MKIRKLLAFVLALIMLASLVGCGAKEEAAAPEDAQDVVKEEAPKEETPKIEEPAGDEPIEIQFWYQNNATYVTAFDELAAKFNETNGKGITVVATGYDSSALESAVTAGMMDGTAPVLFYTRSNAYFANLCGEGMLEDLSGYGLPLNDIAVTAATRADGGLYAAALGYQPICLAYNKDIFAENNIAVPTNYAELEAAVNTLKAAGYDGIAYPGGAAGHVWLSRAVFHTTMGTAGYKALEEGIDAGTITALPDDAVAALNSMSELGGLLCSGADTMTQDVLFTMFSTGEIPMVFIQPSNLITSEAFADINAGILPVYSNSGNGEFYGEITCMMSMNKQSADEEKSAALEFIKFVMAEENMTSFANITCDMTTIDVMPDHRYGSEFVDAVAAEGMTLRSLTQVSKSEFWKSELDNMILEIIFSGADANAKIEDFNQHLVDAEIASMS